MEEIINLFKLIAVVVVVLVSASLPWLMMLAYGFRSLALEMEQTQFTAGLGDAYIYLLIIAMISGALILYGLVGWITKNKKRLFDI